MTEQTEPATITDPAWLQQQYAAVIRRWWDTDDGGADEIAAAVLAVRDQHLDQLRQRLTLADTTLNTDAAEQLHLVDAMRQQNLDAAAAAIQRAEHAEAGLARVTAVRGHWQERLLPSPAHELLTELHAALDEPARPAATEATEADQRPDQPEETHP